MSGEAVSKNDVTFLYDLVWGYRAARVLQVANSLDIFTILSGREMSVKQVCQNCSTQPEMTEKLLIACTAMELLKKQGELYKNTKLAETYLVRGTDLYQGEIIAHSASLCSFWDKLEDELRISSGTIKEQDEHRNFIMGMHNIALAGRAQMFIEAVDLSGRKTLI